MDINDWVRQTYNNLTLSEESFEYLYLRGATDAFLESFGVRTWTPSELPCPDKIFVGDFGLHGEGLAGYILFPYVNPKGTNIIGFEARRWDVKIIRDIRFQSARWNPVWLGLQEAMPKIWQGADLWIVEGVYDLMALRRVLPERVALLASISSDMSRRHFDFIARFVTGRVYIAYDMDPPGREGSEKVCRRLRQMGVEVIPVSYTGGKDPGVIWDQGKVEGLKHAFHKYVQ